MDYGSLLQASGFIWSPITFGILSSLAVALTWLAFVPAWSRTVIEERLGGILGSVDVIEEAETNRPFTVRALAPALRQILRLLGRLAPKRNVELTEKMLVQAGEPGGLTVLDFLGLRLLLAGVLAGGYFLVFARSEALMIVVRNCGVLVGLGYLLPLLWLRARVKARQKEITRALPDALDMLTIGVEAGLAFESALLKVGERWENALTREFRRAVLEMRVGTARDVALRRMADRAGVPDLSTFVTVLVQSSQLGVSITQILHSQAAQMRERRRQRAEELARQASVKMIFPLVFFVFPALIVVVVGPGIPEFIDVLFVRLGGAAPANFP